MKHVLISIRPKWCELIISGEKTIEVRKTRPKLKPPFKCYIYCTKDNNDHDPNKNFWKMDSTGFNHLSNGKVIGEFVCDSIFDGSTGAQEWVYISENCCVPGSELYGYCGEDKNGDTKYCYGWHISDLKIYDKPKELSRFKGRTLVWRGNNHVHVYEAMTRPPQSWCYVEEE